VTDDIAAERDRLRTKLAELRATLDDKFVVGGEGVIDGQRGRLVLGEPNDVGIVKRVAGELRPIDEFGQPLWRFVPSPDARKRPMTDRELVPRPAEDDRTLIAEALFMAVTHYDEPVMDGSELDFAVWEDSEAHADAVLAALAAAGREIVERSQPLAPITSERPQPFAELWENAVEQQIQELSDNIQNEVQGVRTNTMAPEPMTDREPTPREVALQEQVDILKMQLARSAELSHKKVGLPGRWDSVRLRFV
jgi:hypothetical protein